MGVPVNLEFKGTNQINGNKPTREHQSENERAQIKKWCKFVWGIKAKRHKTNWHRRRPWCASIWPVGRVAEESYCLIIGTV